MLMMMTMKTMMLTMVMAITLIPLQRWYPCSYSGTTPSSRVLVVRITASNECGASEVQCVCWTDESMIKGLEICSSDRTDAEVTHAQCPGNECYY